MRRTHASYALAAVAAFFCTYSAWTTYLLSAESNANKARHAVEQQDLACIGYDGKLISFEVSNNWKECTRVTWRYSDEQGVK